jgi:hypothetical protein
MALYASENTTTRTPAPSGTHMGRCYGVIDLGTHVNPQHGSKARKVLLQWELPTETHTFDEKKGAEPFVVSRQFSLSLNEKGALRPFLVSWRGVDFTSEELNKFDIAKLANQPCMVTVIHKRDGDKVYANVSQVSKLPKQMGECPPAHNRITVLSLDMDFDQDVYNALPEWIKKKIQESPEFRSLSGERDFSQASDAGQSYHSGIDESEIPFTKPHYLTVGGW